VKSLVIIPTYNEIDNIKRIIESVLPQDNSIEILIVDDNSPDGTGKVVLDIMKETDRLHLIERKGKLGLGTAYVEGFKFAIQNRFDYVIEMDADFSHNPDDLPRLLFEIQDHDLVIGSRYVSGVNVVNWPMSRLILSYLASFYVKVITGMKIDDPTGGFKCFRRSILEKIDLDSIISDGYSFQVEMNYRVYHRGYRVKEIPIIFYERRDGKSKMSKNIVIEAIWKVWRLRLMAILGKL
jgi:dolichol-phosphate mannosyltransferase